MRPYYYNNNATTPPSQPQSAPGLFSALPPITALLIKINIAFFLLFVILGKGPLYQSLSLSLDGVTQGYIWQPFTYMFLHAGFMHLLFNMFTLFFLGPETERAMGPRHFLAMYLLSGVMGGLGWLWLSAPSNPCVGASGAIFGVLAAFATLFPKRELMLLFLPFPIPAWKMVLGFAAVEFFLARGSSSGVAHTAHLAGAFAGFLYIDQLYESTLLRRGWKFLQSKVFKRAYTPPPSPPPPDPTEVDRILDKITDKGIGALTKHERKILHRASRTF